MITRFVLPLILVFIISTSFIVFWELHFPSKLSYLSSPFEYQKMQIGGESIGEKTAFQNFIIPVETITNDEKIRFWTGLSLFRNPWVAAPSSTKDRDGLGPLFNARSCIACHKAGGKGRLSSIVMRMGNNTFGTDANYGEQIQTQSILPNLTNELAPEAKILRSTKFVYGTYADGQEYQLTQPEYRLSNLYYGALNNDSHMSPRLAPAIYGLGLLDAISDTDLLANEDRFDANRDGISARYNRVIDVETGKSEIGRFGLKSQHPNLKQQIAAAFKHDIGITNSLFKAESCTDNQLHCQQWAKNTKDSEVEIPNKLLNLVVDFSLFLAAPHARKTYKSNIESGKKLFYQLKCNACHKASYITDPNYPVTALANQKIWPYTDLALHDMGEVLADKVNVFDATGQEWRTPPLWGLGIQEQINGEQKYLHDGRARSIEEAILWHGGEAQSSQQQFKQLRQNDRQQLIEFLRTL